MSIKNVKRMSQTLTKTFFEYFLSSKMGRGALAVAGGSGGQPIFDPKSDPKIIFQCPGYFFDIFIIIILITSQRVAQDR